MNYIGFSRLQATVVYACLAGGLPQLLTAQSGVDAAQFRLVTHVGRESDSVQFHEVADIAVSDSGFVVVADAGNSRLVILDPAGNYLRTIGRRGAGPGEFRYPGSIWLGNTGLAFDAPQRRVVEFDLQGKVRETRQLPTPAGLNITRLLPVSSGGFVGATSPIFSPGSSAHTPNEVVVRVNGEAARIDTLIAFRSGAVMWQWVSNPNAFGLAAADMGPAGAWAMIGDSLVVIGNGQTGEVRWLDVRGRIRMLRRAFIGVTGRPTTESDRRAIVERLRAAGKVRQDVEVQYPRVWSVITKIVPAQNGDLWIQGAEQSDDNLWAVLPRGKDTLKIVRLPAGFRLFAVSNQRIYGVSTTPLGEEFVTIYSMR